MEDALLEALDHGARQGASLIEVRAEETMKTLITVKDGKIEVSREGFDSGAGIRGLFGGAWGYASTSKVNPASLRKAVEKPSSLLGLSAGGLKHL